MWKQVRIAVSIALAISLSFMFLNRGGLPDDFESWADLAFGTTIGLSLWLSMSSLNSWLAPRVQWLDRPARSFLIVMVANVLVASLALAVVRVSFLVGVFGWTFDSWLAKESIREYVFPVLIGLFISAVYQGAAFIHLWKQSLIQAEQHKSANLTAKYEALNAQINPHFLFNSLNVLSSLVRSDADKAEHFIQGLSEVYRYVLAVRNEPTVPIAQELEAMYAYAKLVQTRFGAERLQLDVQLDETTGGRIVPLALQMLIENAVKHNGATRSAPLRISVSREDDHFVVRNNRVKLFEQPAGSGIGLENIRERYRLNGVADIVVEETADAFTVKLPVLDA